MLQLLQHYFTIAALSHLIHNKSTCQACNAKLLSNYNILCVVTTYSTLRLIMYCSGHRLKECGVLHAWSHSGRPLSEHSTALQLERASSHDHMVLQSAGQRLVILCLHMAVVRTKTCQHMHKVICQYLQAGYMTITARVRVTKACRQFKSDHDKDQL